MRLDAGIGSNPITAAARAQRAEAAGYDAAWASETAHDPFLALAPAAVATERIELGTSIAVAFARNPMTTAHAGWDLQLLSDGRFILGLGSQIEAHITKRFGMPWSRPAARMAEYVAALHAIWDAWEGTAKLDFRGDFYTHTYTNPMFVPPPQPHGRPPVYVAAVGPLMTQAAGRAADGLLCHGFTTAGYLREVTLPALRRGRETAGRPADSVAVALLAMAVVGDTPEAQAAAATGIRMQIAFYGSTPAYRGVLEHHGWGDAQTELHALVRQGRWGDMADVIDEEMLRTIAAVGTPAEVAATLLARYGDVADRITPVTATDGTGAAAASGAAQQLLASLRAALAERGATPPG